MNNHNEKSGDNAAASLVLKFPTVQGTRLGTTKSSPLSPRMLPSPLGGTPSFLSDELGEKHHGLRSPPFLGVQQPSAKDSSSVLPASLAATMCFPLHSLYGQAASYTLVPNGFLPMNAASMVSQHTFDRQMAFFNSAATAASLSASNKTRNESLARLSAFTSAAAYRNFPPSTGYQKHCFGFPTVFPGSDLTGYASNTLSGLSSSEGTIIDSPPPLKRRCFGDKELSPTGDGRDSTLTPDGVGIDRDEKPAVSSPTGTSWNRSHGQNACPLCGLTLSGLDLIAHFREEVENLEELHKTRLREWINAENARNRTPATPELRPLSQSPGVYDKKLPFSRWETYQRVRQNRHARLSALVRNCRKKPGEPEQDLRRTLDLTQGGRRVLMTVTVDENESEMAMRRASVNENKDSLVSSAAHCEVEATSRSQNPSEAGNTEDGHLESTNGLPLSPTSSVGGKFADSSSPRWNGLSSQTPGEHTSTTSATTTTSQDGRSSDESQPTSSNVVSNGLSLCSISSTDDRIPPEQLVEILQSRLRELEESQNAPNSVKCLVCMKAYVKPVVSVVCWHVHCEECWLRILGVRKLCPQCEVITSPSDLRRVHL